MYLLVIFTIIIAVIIALFLLNFYKNPKRTVPKGSNVVAPADGRIISVIYISKETLKIKKGLIGKIKTYTKDVANECYVISIFMSPFDAHYNRAPIEGKIKSIKHTKGKFFNAYDLVKSFENEKNEILIQNKQLKVKVIQIAGFLARRIFCYVKPHQKVNKGQKIGFIALGSQTAIILPKQLKLIIKTGDRVKAGESVLANLGGNNG